MRAKFLTFWTKIFRIDRNLCSIIHYVVNSG